jgi:hypothetical protein
MTSEAELSQKAGLPQATCWGCLTAIEVGEDYVKVPITSVGRIAIAHHYHAECYRVMRALRRRRHREKRAASGATREPADPGG